MTRLLINDVHQAVEKSVLCWLATCDEHGQPNVSPKEMFAVADDEHIVVANIASPQSANNIRINPQLCLSFVGVFVQKGFKVWARALRLNARRPSIHAG